LKFQLELEGIRVCTCGDLSELMALAELPQAQCIVLDDSLPRKDPFLLVRTLKTRQIDIPVILVAGNATPVLRERASQAGIKQVLSKPLLGGELVDAIRENIAGSGA
jgi:CheY-like chemotaxis protein